jgi:hypothetical protein
MKLCVGNALIFIPFLLTIDELRLQAGNGDFLFSIGKYYVAEGIYKVFYLHL